MRTARTAAGTATAAGGALLLVVLAATGAGAAPGSTAAAPPSPAPSASAPPSSGVREVVQLDGPDGPVFRSRPVSSGGARAVTTGERDSRVRAVGAGSLRPQQWALNRVQFERAWTVSRGTGVVVGVIDSGVDASLPSLKGRVLPGWTFQGAGYQQHAGQVDEVGHGTHVAGIIAADPAAGGVSGAAPGVRVLPVSVLDDQGSGWSSDVANGIVWATNHGARVLNLSFGSSSPSNAVRAALAYAQGKGVVVVAAVGNEGEDGTYEYPAAYQGVVGVGALDPGDRAAPFSTTGPLVDLTAPGESVLSTVPRAVDPAGAARRSGTSMAAPYVAAAAALVRAASPSASPAEVTERLLATAEDLGPEGRDNAYGAGLVDPVRALGLARVPLPDRLDPPTGLRLSMRPDDTVDLSWEPVAGARGYVVLLSGLPLNLGAEEGEPPAYGLHGTSAHFPEFPRGAPLPLQVAAVDGLGLWSTLSPPFRALVPPRPVVAPVQVRAASPHSRTVRLSWAPVAQRGVIGYGILRDGQAYDSVEGTTFVDSPATAGSDAPSDGIRHTYRVVTLTESASSDPSAAVVVTPYAFWATSAPRLTTATRGGAVRVAWSAPVRGQRGWRVYVDGRLAVTLPRDARGTDVRRAGAHDVTVVRFSRPADQGPRATVRVTVSRVV